MSEEKTEKEVKKEKAKEIIELQNEIDKENLAILSKMLITGCAAQIAVEGIDDLREFNVFNKGTKNKMQNFQNFIMREMASVVETTYLLDDEMTIALTRSIENYLKVNFQGLVNAKPEEIIARYFDGDK